MGSTDCVPAGATSGQGERTRYFSRQLITADDLTQDQKYHRDRRRLHNRLLHGWGIVCGLEVNLNKRLDVPLNVTICPGYALSPQGDEIFVPLEIQFDLGKRLAGHDAPCHHPCTGGTSRAVDSVKELYVVIKYTECLSHPVRVSPIGCGCDDTACEYSRIRDSYEISCLDTLPASYTNVPPDIDVCKVLTTDKVIPCPPCPEDPWVILAKVQLSPERNSIESLGVNDRRLVLSAAIVQEYIHKQCGVE